MDEADDDKIEEIAPGDEEEVADALKKATDSDAESADSDVDSDEEDMVAPPDTNCGGLTWVLPHQRRTLDFMSRMEYAQVLAQRAQQIAKTNVSFANGSTPREKAASEIAEKKCPLTVHRKIGNTIEAISINDLDLPPGVSVDL
ncbi:MAG: hypothetical protein P1U53_15470 [Sulfitobacter sp.]|nr:hypothetical protein [Sulfitobacter sp.]